MKRLVIINIDLNNFEEDFLKEIKQFGTYAIISESCYAIYSSMDVNELLDRLKNCSQDFNRIFVIDVNGNCAWKNPKCDEDWLEKYTKRKE